MSSILYCIQLQEVIYVDYNVNAHQEIIANVALQQFK